jgi:uncharacterized protein YjgD (DUF1641 family)
MIDVSHQKKLIYKIQKISDEIIENYTSIREAESISPHLRRRGLLLKILEKTSLQREDIQSLELINNHFETRIIDLINQDLIETESHLNHIKNNKNKLYSYMVNE